MFAQDYFPSKSLSRVKSCCSRNRLVFSSSSALQLVLAVEESIASSEIDDGNFLGVSSGLDSYLVGVALDSAGPQLRWYSKTVALSKTLLPPEVAQGVLGLVHILTDLVLLLGVDGIPRLVHKDHGCRPYPHDQADQHYTALAAGGRGRFVALGSLNGQVHVSKVEEESSWTRSVSVGFDGPVSSLHFFSGPDGDCLAVGSGIGSLVVVGLNLDVLTVLWTREIVQLDAQILAITDTLDINRGFSLTVGCADGRLCSYGANPVTGQWEELWTFTLPDVVLGLHSFDIDQDGLDELVAVTGSGVHVLRARPDDVHRKIREVSEVLGELELLQKGVLPT